MMRKTFTVRDLPVEERPRERLIAQGAGAISSQELLAILLGRGTAGLSVLSIAQLLLARFGSLSGVVNASLEELQEIDGLGLAKATQLKACLEISHRVVKDDFVGENNRNISKAVASPEDLYKIVRSRVRKLAQEHFFVISFDNRNRVLGVDEVAMGTINTSVVHPREIFDTAIKRKATCIAVAHNHPSGDPQPSEADVMVTKRLSDAGKLMGIQLLDHVIISRTGAFSFKENRLLD